MGGGVPHRQGEICLEGWSIASVCHLYFTRASGQHFLRYISVGQLKVVRMCVEASLKNVNKIHNVKHVVW